MAPPSAVHTHKRNARCVSRAPDPFPESNNLGSRRFHTIQPYSFSCPHVYVYVLYTHTHTYKYTYIYTYIYRYIYYRHRHTHTFLKPVSSSKIISVFLGHPTLFLRATTGREHACLGEASPLPMSGQRGMHTAMSNSVQRLAPPPVPISRTLTSNLARLADAAVVSTPPSVFTPLATTQTTTYV